MESKALSRAKSHVQSKLKEIILTQSPHYLIPGHNKYNVDKDLNLQSTSEMFQEYPYYCDLPKPLLPPCKMKRDSKEDSSLQLIYVKNKIKDDINRYLELYKKYSKSLDTCDKNKMGSKKENLKLPKYVAEIAEILECDPDSNFSGSYNWYYSGGTLNGIMCDNKNILVFPYSGELIAIPIELKEDSTFMPNYKNATKLNIDENIFQVTCSSFNNNGRILTRHKNKCHLISLFNLDKKKMKLLNIDSRTSDVPYVSADLDPLDLNKYCTVNIDRSIRIWDSSKTKHILKGKVPVSGFLENDWAFIKYDESENIIKFIDRHCVYYYDTRMSLENYALKMCPQDNLEDCESISSYITSCKSEYYSYIGSNHSLFLLDSRIPDNSIVKKWTHQFKSSPLFTDICFKENNEFIIIASQIAGETAVILNNWISSEIPPESICTPFTPPSCIETLNILQSKGKCLDPSIRPRLKLCNTGCMATVDQHDIFLFTQNSINDIFYQGIGYVESVALNSLENNKSLYKLKMWDRQILKNSYQDSIAPLIITKRADARKIFRSFFDKKIKSTSMNNVESEIFDYTPSWKRSITELSEFIDILAQELLTHWEISEDNPPVTTAEPHQKVLHWLGIVEENQDTLKDKLNLNQESGALENQKPNNCQNSDIILAHNSESIQQLFLPKVKSQIPKDKNVKQTKFVPGF